MFAFNGGVNYIFAGPAGIPGVQPQGFGEAEEAAVEADVDVRNSRDGAGEVAGASQGADGLGGGGVVGVVALGGDVKNCRRKERLGRKQRAGQEEEDGSFHSRLILAVVS